MTSVRIRTATIDDIQHIISLISSAASVLIPHAHSVYWGFINFYPSMNVVAEKDGELVGWCGGVKPDDSTGFIWQIFVDTAHRRQGVAEEMVYKVLRDNFDGGVNAIQLAIARDNDASHQLFSKVVSECGKTMRKTDENKFLLETYNEDLYQVE